MKDGSYTDELLHYGVLGMKWGKRKAQPFSVKAAGHRVMAGVYGLNEKAYKKSNPTLSSMNKAARTTQLKLAEKAQKEAIEKKSAKGKATVNKTIEKNGRKKISSISSRASSLGHKALAKVYEINEKTYQKSNPTLSSMNRAAKEEQLRLAASKR